jgi:hypothetical protein
MNREKAISWLLLGAGGLFLLGRAVLTEQGFGKAYVKEVRINPSSRTDLRVNQVNASLKERSTASNFALSVPRSIGLWAAAFFTLAIFSFLYRDNPFYRVAEAVMVGVSAGYYMVIGFWDTLVPKLFARLAPLAMQWAVPIAREDLDRDPPQTEWIYLAPLILGLMLLWRIMPRGGWVARFPLAFIVGTFAGIRLLSYLEADFISQIRNTIVPLLVMGGTTGALDVWASLRNMGTLLGVIACLTYFFFSADHAGIVGRVARVGVWYLMITFGASFAFTVMGRIALLAARLEFLFDDWLWLIDPTSNRVMPP